MTNQGTLWASLIASSGVAAITTLIVEYFAKPWMDARKERILEKARAERQAIDGLKQASFAIGQILALRDSQETEYGRQKTIQLASESEPLVAHAVRVLDVRAAYQKEWFTSTGIVRAICLMLQQEIRDTFPWDDLDVASETIGDFCEFFQLPRARFIKRRYHYRLIRGSRLPPISEDAEVTHPSDTAASSQGVSDVD